MRKVTLFVILLFVFGILDVVFAQVRSDSSDYPNLDVSGFLRFQPALSVDGRNPNNRNINNSSRTLNMFRTWGELETIYDVSKRWRLYGKFRLITDQADSLDKNLSNFDNFPNDFGGNGWMLRGDSNHVSFEAWELYTDLRLGDLWLRLGKQEIVWGETIANRVLDIVNPLDLSWHLFIDPFTEEFDNIRIPQWFFLANYRIRNPWIDAFQIELIANPGDVVPTLLPAKGSPYNLVPTFVTVKDRVPRGKGIWGGRLKGDFTHDFNFSLIYLTKPVDDAIAVSTGAVVDPKFGLPTEVAPGVFVPLRFLNKGVHPRVNIIGGSLNYWHDPIGTQFRMETTYTPDMPFQKTPPPGAGVTSIRRRGEAKIAFVIERPTVLVPGLDPTQILGLTFFQTIREGSPRGIQILNRRVSKTTESLAFVLSQPILRKQVFLNFLAVHDFDGSSWFQPGVRYLHGDHLRFDLWANFFTGSDERAGKLSALKFANEVAFRVTWGFDVKSLLKGK